MTPALHPYLLRAIMYRMLNPQLYIEAWVTYLPGPTGVRVDDINTAMNILVIEILRV